MMRWTLILLTPLLLAGCIKDTESYYVNGNEHALSVRVEQAYFWNDEVALKLVASRLPECQRQFPLATVPLSELAVELYGNGENTWNVRVGQQAWRVETQTCTLLATAPADAPGELVGTFRVSGDKLVFEAAPGQQPQAASAPVSDGGEPAQQ